MDAVIGPAWAALALLVLASAPKITYPFDTLRALRMAGLRLRPWTVRVFGALEAVLGVVALLTGHPAALALAALSYLGFAGFVTYALTRSTPLASCGCFGKADSPPTVLHLVLVSGFAAVLGWLAVTAVYGSHDQVGLAHQLLANPVPAAVTAGFAGLICWFAYLAMTALPAMTARPVALPTQPLTRTGGSRP